MKNDDGTVTLWMLVENTDGPNKGLWVLYWGTKKQAVKGRRHEAIDALWYSSFRRHFGPMTPGKVYRLDCRMTEEADDDEG